MKFSKKDCYKFVKMKIFNPGSYTMIINIKNRRYHNFDNINYKYMRLFIVKLLNGIDFEEGVECIY